MIEGGFCNVCRRESLTRQAIYVHIDAGDCGLLDWRADVCPECLEIPARMTSDFHAYVAQRKLYKKPVADVKRPLMEWPKGGYTQRRGAEEPTPWRVKVRAVVAMVKKRLA